MSSVVDAAVCDRTVTERAKKRPKNALQKVKLWSTVVHGYVECVRLKLSGLSKADSSLQRHVLVYRRLLELACVERHGGIDIVHAKRIQTCARIEQRVKELERRLRKEGDNLPFPEWVSGRDRVVKWAEAGDRIVASLGLEQQQMSDILAIIDGTPPTVAELDAGRNGKDSGAPDQLEGTATRQSEDSTGCETSREDGSANAS